MSQAAETNGNPTRGRQLSAADHERLLNLALRSSSRREDAEAARAELYEAIREAHRNGASITSIAVAAGLSTTRTHVIATT
jgi:hypothetical protein